MNLESFVTHFSYYTRSVHLTHLKARVRVGEREFCDDDLFLKGFFKIFLMFLLFVFDIIGYVCFFQFVGSFLMNN